MHIVQVLLIFRTKKKVYILVEIFSLPYVSDKTIHMWELQKLIKFSYSTFDVFLVHAV